MAREFSIKLGQGEKTLKAAVNDHERELAKKLGGVRQPNSGATDKHKGDIKLTNFLLDSKETSNNSIVISGRELTKITREADGERLVPGLVVTVKTPSTVPSEWVMIPLATFSHMVVMKQDKDVQGTQY